MVQPANQTFDEILNDIKNQNIIPVVTNANLDVVKTLEENLPDAKVSTVVIDDISEKLDSQVAKVPSIDALDSQDRMKIIL